MAVKKPRAPGLQPSRVNGLAPVAPFVAWGKDQLIRKTSALANDIIALFRAYKGVFTYIQLTDVEPTDPHPIDVYCHDRGLMIRDPETPTATVYVDIAGSFYANGSHVKFSRFAGGTEEILFYDHVSDETFIRITRVGANDYTIEQKVGTAWVELGTVDNIATHAALTATHGVAEVADAADLTAHAADTSTHGVSKVADDAGIGCKAWNSGNVSIADVTNVVIPLDSEEYDTDTIHDLSTNTSRLTCKTAGVYIVTATVVFASNATGFRQIMLWKNGAWNLSEASHKAAAASGAATEITISALVDLAVNDYMEVYAYQNSGAALNVTNYLHFPHLSMQRISG